jgi:hypothetical protein
MSEVGVSTAGAVREVSATRVCRVVGFVSNAASSKGVPTGVLTGASTGSVVSDGAPSSCFDSWRGCSFDGESFPNTSGCSGTIALNLYRAHVSVKIDLFLNSSEIKAAIAARRWIP